MKNIQKKLIINLSIAMLISLAMPVVTYGMKRTREEEVKKETDIVSREELHKEFKLLLPEVQQHIQNLMLGNAIRFLATHPIILNNISKIKISGNKIVTVSADNIAKIWSIDNRQLKLLDTITGPDGNPAHVTSVAIHDNNIVVGSLNDAAKIWHIDNDQLQLLHTLTAPTINTESSNPVAISATKAIVESAFPRNNRIGITIWDITTGAPLYIIPFLDANGGVFIQDLAVGNDRLVAFLTNGMIIIWDMNTGKVLSRRLTPQMISMHSQAISGNRAIVIVDGIIKVWDIHTDKGLWTITLKKGPNEQPIPALHAAISGDKVVASLADGTVRVLDMNTNKQQRLATRNNQTLTSLAVSDTAAVGIDNQNGSAKIWLLSRPFEGTPQNNPLVWIVENATMSQANLIKQAYEATIAGQEFILDSNDLQVFSGLPMPVKRYLLNRLTIRR